MKKYEVMTKELKEQGYKVLRMWHSNIKRMSLEDFNKILNEFK